MQRIYIFIRQIADVRRDPQQDMIAAEHELALLIDEARCWSACPDTEIIENEANPLATPPPPPDNRPQNPGTPRDGSSRCSRLLLFLLRKSVCSEHRQGICDPLAGMEAPHALRKPMTGTGHIDSLPVLCCMHPANPSWSGWWCVRMILWICAQSQLFPNHPLSSDRVWSWTPIGNNIFLIVMQDIAVHPPQGRAPAPSHGRSHAHRYDKRTPSHTSFRCLTNVQVVLTPYLRFNTRMSTQVTTQINNLLSA